MPPVPSTTPSTYRPPRTRVPIAAMAQSYTIHPRRLLLPPPCPPRDQNGTAGSPPAKHPAAAARPPPPGRTRAARQHLDADDRSAGHGGQGPGDEHQGQAATGGLTLPPV